MKGNIRLSSKKMDLNHVCKHVIQNQRKNVFVLSFIEFRLLTFVYFTILYQNSMQRCDNLYSHSYVWPAT